MKALIPWLFKFCSEISSAYEVLSNQVKRQEYDLSLKYSRYPQSFDSSEYWQSRQPRQSPFSDQQSYDPRQGSDLKHIFALKPQ